MSWQSDIDELRRQQQMAQEMGGVDGVAFQHGRGKLTIRERVDVLADPGSFQEIGALAGTAVWDGDHVESLKPSNTVIGPCIRCRSVELVSRSPASGCLAWTLGL